jgi:polyhydroxybutyrate depolymerase
MVSIRILGAVVVLCCVANSCSSSTSDAPGTAGSSSGGSAGSSNNGGSAGSSSGTGGSSNAGSPGAAGSNDVGGGAVERSAGCGRAPQLATGDQELEVGGVTRTFILDLPSDYDEDTAYPLLFGFHGRGFSGAEFRSASYGNLLSVAGDDAIVVHPDALGDVELAWDTDSAEDVRFFDAMLEELGDALCVDEARVFAAGHSSGGYFINKLACERGDQLRAIAAVAGGGPFGQNGGSPSCTGPVSAWIAHAEDDQTVLFVNGENSRDYWVTTDACDEDSYDAVAPGPCVAYEGCRAGLAVSWCEYDGGHDWPSFGAQSIWNFFERF